MTDADPAHGALALTCPACAVSLPQPVVSGAQACASCGVEFEAVAFDPPREPQLAIASSHAGTACAQHARNLATAACSRCGAYMCDLCAIDCDQRLVCPPCFERLTSEGALPSLRSHFVDYNSVSLRLGLLGIPLSLFLFGVIIGPAAILYSLRGMRQNRQLDEAIHPIRGIIGLLLGILVTVIGALLLGLIFRSAGRHHP